MVEDETMTVAEAVLEQAGRIRRFSSVRTQGFYAVAFRAFVAGLFGSLVIAGPFALHLVTSDALSRKIARRLAHRFNVEVRIGEVSPLGLLHPGLRISGLEMTWKVAAGKDTRRFAAPGTKASRHAEPLGTIGTGYVAGRLMAPSVELRLSLATRRLDRVLFHRVWMQGGPDLLHRLGIGRSGRKSDRAAARMARPKKLARRKGRGRVVPTIVFDKGGFQLKPKAGFHVLGGIDRVVLSFHGRSWHVTGRADVALHRGDFRAMARLAGQAVVASASSHRRFGGKISFRREGRWARWAASHVSIRRLEVSKLFLSWLNGSGERATWTGRAQIVELTDGLSVAEAQLRRGTKSTLSLRAVVDLARQRYEMHSRARGIDANEGNRRVGAMLSAIGVSKEAMLRGVDFHDATLDWILDGRIQPGVETVSGTLHLAGPVTVTRRWLARRPVTWQRLEMTATGGARREQGSLVLDLNRVRIRNQGLSMSLSGRISRHDGVIQGSVRARLPQTDCQTMLTSLPSGLAPVLDGMALSGRVGADLILSARSDRLSELVLQTGLFGPGCKVVRDPDRGDVHRLLAEHSIAGQDRNGRPLRWVIGPSNPAFRPLTRLPHHLVRAFMMTEDRRFFRHQGFDWDQIRRALAFDLEHHALLKGASSISQQVVKNEFLTQRKTFARKLQEAVLTWRLEQVVPKKRILELYLNLVEMGPGIYGVARGARTYFGRDVRWITPMQSLHLAAITPSPRRCYRDFRGGRINMAWLLRLKSLLHRMYRSGFITAPEYAKSNAQKFYLAAF